MSESLGDNLIFLISQPRSGSTLLQRILGEHPDIHTTSEPWLMMYPLYALTTEQDCHRVGHNAAMTQRALSAFLGEIPEGYARYQQYLRQMYIAVYNDALAEAGKPVFLDKTPRYYYIVNQLHTMFPQARFIFLVRNPLAVLASMIKTWVGDHWFMLYKYRDDLLCAPTYLLEGQTTLGENCVRVQYENLLADPAAEVTRICTHLDITFLPDMLSYHAAEATPWVMGDKTHVDKYQKPMAQHADKWLQSLENPQVWRLLNDYLLYLGDEQLKRIGYDVNELHEQMEAHRPAKRQLLLTFPLQWLLRCPPHQRAWAEIEIMTFRRIWLRHGLPTAFGRLVKEIF